MSTAPRLAVLHPGSMGAAVAAAARSAGVSVGCCLAGRSAATVARARAAGIDELPDVAALASCEVLLSVCPPAEAEAVARTVAGAGFGGVYVDANAVAPRTALRVAAVVESAGARFVDGGLIGPPPTAPGRTRLYLSGDDAEQAAGLFAGSDLEALCIGGGAGAASALKMAYAAYTKGHGALLTGVRAFASAAGVEEALLEEWARSQPGLEARSEGAARGTAPRAWRFEGEMREIAAAFAACDLPSGFHEAAAELYGRLSAFKDRSPPPSLDEILAVLDSAQGGGTPMG